MAAYRRVYDSRHLHADCQEPYQLRNPTLGNRVWGTFIFFTITPAAAVQIVSRTDERRGQNGRISTRRWARATVCSVWQWQCFLAASATAEKFTQTNNSVCQWRRRLANRQGRFNQWAHWARAQGPDFFFFLRGPNWLWWNIFLTNYLIVDASAWSYKH